MTALVPEERLTTSAAPNVSFSRLVMLSKVPVDENSMLPLSPRMFAFAPLPAPVTTDMESIPLPPTTTLNPSETVMVSVPETDGVREATVKVPSPLTWMSPASPMTKLFPGPS